MGGGIRIVGGADGGVDLFLRGEETGDAAFLVPAEPGLARLTQHLAAQEVDELADDDEHEGDGVQVVDVVVEDLDADDDTPEVHGQHGDVEEGGRRQTEQERRHAVEEGEAQRVPGQVAADLAVPDGGFKRLPVEDPGLGAVDDHAEEGHLTQDLVHRLHADKVFLPGIGETVERGAQQGKEITLDLVATRDVTAIGAGDVVGSDENAHAADTDQNAEHLRNVISDTQEEEGNHHHDGDGPEVDQLGAQHGCIAVCQHDEVVALDVTERQDNVCSHQKTSN